MLLWVCSIVREIKHVYKQSRKHKAERDAYANHCRSLEEGETREDFRQGVAVKLGLGEIWVKEHSFLPWAEVAEVKAQRRKCGTHYVDAEDSQGGVKSRE